MSLAISKGPGIDSIPIEFCKTAWPLVGKDLLEVFQKCLRTGLLSQSCRRANITLLQKKGDRQDLKNWGSISLRCKDYKIVSKLQSLQLREIMAEGAHVYQAYCVPVISDKINPIQNLIQNVSNVSGSRMEKAFDRVEHHYHLLIPNCLWVQPGRGQVMHDIGAYWKLMAVWFLPSLSREESGEGGHSLECCNSHWPHDIQVLETLEGMSFPGCPG